MVWYRVIRKKTCTNSLECKEVYTLQHGIELLDEGDTAVWFATDCEVGSRSTKTLQKLTTALKNCPECQWLGLPANRIKKKSLSLILKGLESCNKLQVLNLSFNKLGDSGAVEFSKYLEENNSLVAVDLRSNKITADGCEKIVQALKRNKTLLQLDLEGNLIKDIGASNFAALLMDSSCSLEYLDLACNGITETGGSALAIALQEPFCPLRTLSVAGNEIPASMCGEGFAKITETNETLTSLNLEDNGDGWHTIERKLASLESNRNPVKDAMQKFIPIVLNDKEPKPMRLTKLMIVGEFATGKSATLESLFGLDPLFERKSTRGAAICKFRPVENGWKKVNAEESEFLPVVVENARIASKNVGRPQSGIRESLKRISSSVNKFAQIPPLLGRSSPPLLSESEVNELAEDKLHQQAFSNPNPKSAIRFTVWDFGGQDVFQPLHHSFLTANGVYVVVFSIKDLLNKVIAERDAHVATLKGWLNLANLHAKDAPIFLAGTHADIGTLRSKEDDFFEVENILIRKVNIKGFPNIQLNGKISFFPLENTSPDPNRAVFLRESIERAAATLKPTQKEVPMSWLKIIDKLTSYDEDHLELAKVEEIAFGFGLDKSKTKELLQFTHEIGLILFMDVEGLENLVVLKPQWLIGTISKVIAARVHLASDDYDLEEIEELLQHGTVSYSSLCHIWREDKEEIPYLLNFMLETMLISKIGMIGRHQHQQENGESKYLVTSLCTTEEAFEGKDFENGLEIKFDFSDSFLPVGVFQRIVSTAATVTDKPPEVTKTWAIINISGKRAAVLVEGDIIRLKLETSAKNAFNTLESVKSMLEYQREKLFPNMNLTWKVLIVDPSEGGEVDLDEFREARDKNSPSVKLVSGRKIPTNNLKRFERLSIVWESLQPEMKYHCFISHKQSSGGHLAGMLQLLLKSYGLVVWFDQSQQHLTKKSMEAGVKDSSTYILLLTKDVFLSDSVKFELEIALKYEKPIILIHVAESHILGYAEFSHYVETCPSFAPNLLEEHESMPFQRREYLQIAFMDELVRRIKEFI